MRLLMDSDCLIKLVKAALKETVCLNFTVVIPALVKREVVEEGRRQPDAAIVEDNLKRKLLLESKGSASPAKGEEEVFSAFQSGKYDAICSDDRRLLRRLRLLGIPYMTPGVLIAVLVKDGKLTVQQALEKLESLSPMISDEESSAVRLFLSNWSQQ